MSLLRMLCPGPPHVSQDPRPHVLLILDQMMETIGGGERIALRLAELLPARGYRVSLLSFFAHPASACLANPPCPVYLLPIQRVYDATAMRAAWELSRFIDREQVRIVQTFFESSDLWAGLVTKLGSDAKLIWSRRDMGILRARKHRIGYRLLAGLPDAVMAVSEQVRRHVIEQDGIDPPRVETIYNGFDLSRWPPAGSGVPQTGKRVVATVGNIRHVKGHDILVEAAARVVAELPEVSFAVAGGVLDPAYFATLQGRIAELGLGGHFRFAGNLDDPRSFLRDAEVFVLPSRSEGFSNAIVEAMAAGLPVVATDVGGNAEAVQNGVSGTIVPPEQPRALADALLRMLRQPEAARAMGAEGKRLVAERFTTEAMLDRVTAIYRRLLA